MKNWVFELVVGLCMIIGALISFYNLSNQYDEVIIQKDTVILTVPDYSLMKQNDSLCYIIDSLTNTNAKYEEELNIALFKLERIRYYNDIAKNDNNIKYLRGWINRTLNE